MPECGRPVGRSRVADPRPRPPPAPLSHHTGPHRLRLHLASHLWAVARPRGFTAAVPVPGPREVVAHSTRRRRIRAEPASALEHGRRMALEPAGASAARRALRSHGDRLGARPGSADIGGRRVVRAQSVDGPSPGRSQQRRRRHHRRAPPRWPSTGAPSPRAGGVVVGVGGGRGDRRPARVGRGGRRGGAVLGVGAGARGGDRSRHLGTRTAAGPGRRVRDDAGGLRLRVGARRGPRASPGSRSSRHELGGTAVHATSSGLCALAAPDADAVDEAARGACLPTCPTTPTSAPPRCRAPTPPTGATPELRDLVPTSRLGVL